MPPSMNDSGNAAKDTATEKSVNKHTSRALSACEKLNASVIAEKSA
jgi:hypothetical protein